MRQKPGTKQSHGEKVVKPPAAADSTFAAPGGRPSEMLAKGFSSLFMPTELLLFNDTMYSALGCRPPAPEAIAPMEPRPIMQLKSNWTTQVELIIVGSKFPARLTESSHSIAMASHIQCCR